MNAGLKLKALGLLVAVAAFTPGATPAQDAKVSIATSSASLSGSALRVAKELGLFQKHGLDATITPMDTGNIATSALLAGSVNFVTSGVGDAIILQARGQDVVTIAGGYRGFSAVLVLSKAAAAKSQVSPSASASERLKALDGLTIAASSASAPFTLALKPAVEAAGAKVKFSYMAQPAMAAALQTGAVDAFVSAGPYYAGPILNGAGVMWLNGLKGDFPPQNTLINTIVLITKRDFAKANPDLVKRMTAVLSDFAKAIDERPADMKAAIGRLYPDLDAKTLDLIFETEAVGYRTKPLTIEDMAHDISVVKSAGIELPQADRLDPKLMINP